MSMNLQRVTPVKIEAALVTYFLGSNGLNGAGPVTYLDATEPALCEALDAPNFEVAKGWLGQACGGAEGVGEVFEHGWTAAWPDSNAPGYFRFLVLSCAVVASAHADEESQDFGHNLKGFLRTDRAIGRRALPDLWKRLEVWSRRQYDAGNGIRPVILPPPGVGTHIGLTNAIAFPNWRAVKKLRIDIQVNAGFSTASKDPVKTALHICPMVTEERGYRPEMIQAARSFGMLYGRGNSLLELHRFWRVVCYASGDVRRNAKHGPNRVRLELADGVIDADMQVLASFVDEGSGRSASPRVALLVPPARFVRSAKEWGGPATDRWCSFFERGVVPFMSERFGVWVATAAAPDGIEPHRYLIREGLKRRLPVSFQQRLSAVAEGWLHLGPVGASESVDIHRALGIQVEAERSRPLRLEGGVRTRAGWLGRQSLLPMLRSVGTGDVDVRPGAEQSESPMLQQEGPGRFVISTEKTIEGLFRFRLRESVVGDEILAVELPVRFVADAPTHSELSIGRRDTRTEVEFVSPVLASAIPRPFVISSAALAEQANTPHSDRFDDLLEAIYALGRSGWAEGALVESINDMCPGPPPWDVLRALEEAGWLERRLSETWRATYWMLLPPILVPLESNDVSATLLEGAAPAEIRARFTRATCAMGGRVEVRQGFGPFSPHSLVAHGPRTDELAKELGWAVMDRSSSVEGIAPDCWPNGQAATTGFSRHKVWNWQVAGFRGVIDARGVVDLSWWRREDGDRHDLYAVTGAGAEFTTTSRTAAILEAHRRAGMPLFRHLGSSWLRIAEQGYMPLPIAVRLRREEQLASGPVFVDGRWTYAYGEGAGRVAGRIMGWSLFCDPNQILATDRPRREAAAIGLSRHRSDGWSRVRANR
ncbi:hypothetical protein [Comamonas sp. wu1-DMT]|uniref:hypothetical protein n=1 Tax=Comamonas sp. wu1-DMT TaxID=3126390 RepID=UPI0032E3B414